MKVRPWLIVLVVCLAAAACGKKIPPPPDWGKVGENRPALDFAWMKYHRGDPQGAEYLATGYEAGLFGLKRDPEKAALWSAREKELRRRVQVVADAVSKPRKKH